MKSFDISGLNISQIHDIFSNKLGRHTSSEALTEHSMLIIRSSGSSVYTVGKQDLICDANHALYIPSGVSYSFVVTSAGTSYVLSLDTQSGAEECPTSFTVAGGKDISRKAASLVKFWQLKGPAHRSKCLSELYELITLIASEHSFANTLAGKYGLIHKSVKYIESHYADTELYAPLLAEMSGLGQTYYRNIFISVFDVPPTKYITNYRIDKAKELLINTDMSSEEIAAATGFSNSSYFCKVFKATTGFTPSAFAEKGRKIG